MPPPGQGQAKCRWARVPQRESKLPQWHNLQVHPSKSWQWYSKGLLVSEYYRLDTIQNLFWVELGDKSSLYEQPLRSSRLAEAMISYLLIFLS